MTRRIIRHEIRALAAERTLWIAIAAFGALLTYGTINGMRWTERHESTLTAAAAGEEASFTTLRERLERIEAGVEERGSAFRDPTLPGTVGRSLGERRAILPPAPLAATAVGQSDLLPAVVPITTRSGYGLPGREEIANPLHLLTGRLDLAFVILFLLPLTVLALSYDMLSREREGGTLGLVLAQPVHLRTLLAGKLIARGVVVLGLAIATTTALLVAGGVDLTAPGAVRGMGLWAATVTLYSLFWLALAAAANLLGRGSAQQAVALAAVWLLLAIIVPSALAFGSRLLYPVPSRAEMIGAEREAARIAQAEGDEILARNYEDHPELAPGGDAEAGDLMTVAYAVQEEVDALMEGVRRHYDAQVAAQQAFVERLRFLSPVLVAQASLDDVAGTGENRHVDFRTQVEAFRAEFHGFFRPLIYQQVRFTAADVDAIPAWNYREEPLDARRARLATGLLGLLAPTLILGLVCARSLPRFSRTG